MNNYEKILKDKLLERKLISEEKLNSIIKESESKNAAFFPALISNGAINEEEALRLIADESGLEFIDLADKVIDREILEKVPAKFAWHYQFMPLFFEGQKLVIAVNFPLEIKTQDEIELITGSQVKIVLAKKRKIRELLTDCYGLGADTVDKMVSERQKETVVDPDAGIEDIRDKAQEASVIQLVNQIIAQAYRKRATDIHIEPFRGKIRLRYRIDGILFDQPLPENSNRFYFSMVSRIKIMSDLNIVEKRIPQDGRALVRVKDQVLDLRVSVIPSVYGESIVIRVLPTKMFFDLKALGFSETEFDIFSGLLKKPNGIIFVTGPTGSGKTTTLYAALRQVSSQEKKIISIEDPVEYQMKDVIQIQINPSAGLTFAKGLRSMLRHDPDIMMVGEVRDKETAEIAVRVALTGHLVLSTLHTNDAPSSITRLLDIGVEPYLLASSVEAFVAQRLVRVICPKCKIKSSDFDPKFKPYLENFQKQKKDFSFYKGSGCEYCNFTGFYGRTGVYEILTVDKQIREMIKDGLSAAEIRRQAINSGMKTLLQDCWDKVEKGITSPEEAFYLSQDFSLKELEKPAEIVSEKKEVSQSNFNSKTKKTEVTESEDSESQRLHRRVEKKIPVWFKLLEKGEGEVLKIEPQLASQKSQNQMDVFFNEIASPDDSGQVYSGVSEFAENISEGGALIKSSYSLPPGSIIELKLSFPQSQKPIDCLAKVLRIEKNLPESFFIAVCFMDISGGQRKVIQENIRK